MGSVKVEEGQDGQVKVDFNSSKDELSTKKIRRKAEKAMKNEVKAKLYSNFVKSGTLTGGKMEEAGEGDSGFVEDKDLSLLRTLTDDELVKACGGRTAHKGGRHGHKMNAKLARIEAAEAEYMLNHKSKEEAAVALAEDKACARLAEEVEDLTEVKKKKKKRKKEKDDGSIEILKIEDTMTAELNPEPAIKRKKSKKRRREDNIENEEPQEEPGVIKKKKSKKSKKSEESSTSGAEPILLKEEEVSLKKKKKSKRKKLKGGSD